MRLLRFPFAIACALACMGEVRAADPVTVTLHERAAIATSLVTLGDIASISGGDAATRARVAALDVAELKVREPAATVGRRAVEYRLLLAGFDARAVRVAGAGQSAISQTRRVVTAEEVVAAAKSELLRRLPQAAGEPVLELAQPVVVKLPELPANERPVITARPRGRVAVPCRVQMDVSIFSGAEPLLSLAVHLEVKAPGQAGGLVMPAGGIRPPAAAEVLIRPGQRVTMEVHSGDLTVKATGEAQQQGRLGDSIRVQNVDSKKAIIGRVTGPSTVEVDIGGTP